MGGEGFQDDWTPKALRQTAHKVSQQVVRLSQVNSELTIARESEKSSMGKLMEMMLFMRAEEMKRDEERGEHSDRERREEKAERLEIAKKETGN